ncbi:MAG TPA: aminotransferase class IV [Gemmataceae bacterium]|nr:aminotransferase class IV [Gemmataceae bacterium]
MSLVWINGTLIDKADARVSPFDHGFLYGDGAWAHFRAFNGKLFRPESQLGMLYHTLSHQLGIEISLTWDQLKSAIETTLHANNRTEGYIRVLVTRGPGTLGPDPRKLDPQIIILAEEYHPFPIELYEYGLHAAIASNVFDPANIYYGSTLGALYLVLAKQAALRSGCLEAVILHRDQAVRGIEGFLFLVRGGKIHQLSVGYDVLPEVVLELADAQGIPVERDLGISLTMNKLHDLIGSEEIFLAGTTCGVIAIISIDKKPIGSGTEGPVTRQIREAYRRLTRGE